MIKAKTKNKQTKKEEEEEEMKNKEGGSREMRWRRNWVNYLKPNRSIIEKHDMGVR